MHGSTNYFASQETYKIHSSMEFQKMHGGEFFFTGGHRWCITGRKPQYLLRNRAEAAITKCKVMKAWFEI